VGGFFISQPVLLRTASIARCARRQLCHLGEIGYSDDEITRLRERKVV
jgi:hypothetical protein